MTEEQVREYLKDRGCPRVVWQGGKDRLLARWKSFVARIESGQYTNWLIQEYWNDLDTRELVHDIGCDEEVKEWDQRFAAMLIATNIKHWHTDRDRDYDFWNYGYPSNATGFFFEDVKRYILEQSESGDVPTVHS